MEKKFLTVPFEMTGAEEKKVNNVSYGIIKGFASTYGNIDKGYDRIVKGAFDNTLKAYKENKRQIRMFFQHDYMSVIGGFPAYNSDDKGLYVEGNINLDTQRGKEAYALAKQGVLTDFSIGYYTKKYNDITETIKDENGTEVEIPVRELLDIELSEISLVTNPMNDKAIVTDIKSMTKISEISKLLKAKGFSNSEVNDMVYKIKHSGEPRDEEKTVIDKVNEMLIEIKLNEILNKIRRN